MLIDSLPKCSVTVDRCGNVFGPPEKYRRVEKFQSHPFTKNESAWSESAWHLAMLCY